jgi:signal transduction histidine kinase
MTKLNVLIVEDMYETIRGWHRRMEGLGPSELVGERFDAMEILIVRTQQDADKAIREAPPGGYQLILLDLYYPAAPGLHTPNPTSGVESPGMLWLPRLRQSQPDATIVIITRFDQLGHALPIVTAIRDHHANDFIPKDTFFPEFASRIRVAFQNARQDHQRRLLQDEFRSSRRFRALITYPDDVTSLLNGMKIRLSRVADQLESGDPAALSAAPGRIRTEFECLQRGLSRYSDCLGGGQQTPTRQDVAGLVRNLGLINEDIILQAKARFVAPQAGETHEISTYSDDLSAALHEVIHNGADSLNTSHTPATDREIHVSIEEQDGDLMIRLRDNGDGFSDEAMNRMFEAGFSCWPCGNHQGLGLYIARRMMNAIGGDIHANNLPEGGAEVVLTVRDLGTQ